MNILVTFPMKETELHELQRLAPEATFIYEPDLLLAKKHIADAHVIIGDLPHSFLAEDASDDLQWMQLTSSGHRDYSQGGILPAQTTLTTASGAYGTAVAEHMLGQLLMHICHLDLYQESQHRRMRKYHGPVKTIAGSTTLILGLGDVGSSFAKSMQALGSHVIGIRRDTTCKPDYVKSVYPLEQLDILLPQADFVAVCLPKDSVFRHLFDSNRLARMKPGSVLLNISAGFMMDVDALDQALRQGPLSGACLDIDSVFSLPQNHPLWKAPGLHMTPHIAGIIDTQYTYDQILQIIKTNLQAFINGKDLVNQVTVAVPSFSLEQAIDGVVKSFPCKDIYK